MQVYSVLEDHLCDDHYYKASPHTVAIYATKKAAQLAVARYKRECKRKLEKSEEENTRTIDGVVYRSMDLEYVKCNTYRYVPKDKYDYSAMWERYPERWIKEDAVIE